MTTTQKSTSTSPITNIAISFPHAAGRQGQRVVSDTTVREEALENGRLIGLYWSASGHVEAENQIHRLPDINCLNIPTNVFELEMDGQSLHNRWDWAGKFTRPGRQGTTEAVIELRHQVKPVSVRVVTRLDGSPILARYLEITNTGSVPLPLSSVSPCSGVLWDARTQAGIRTINPSLDLRTHSKFDLGYFLAEGWGEEGDFTWQALPRETFSVERSDKEKHFGWPYYIVRNNLTGEQFFIGIAWSGNNVIRFNNRRDGTLSFRMGPMGKAPLRVVAPGETVTSAEVHIGPMHCGVDQAVANWHRHVRTSVLPPRPKGKEMYTIAGRVVEQPGDWILREVDVASAMGVEGFMVDAGWYGDTFGAWPNLRGDWNEGHWLPGGMAGVRDYIHEKGLLFGLWHEPECLMSESRTGKEHPDWFLCSDEGRRIENMLNLGHPDAAKHFEEEVVRIVRDFKLDFYKLDYNTNPAEDGQNARDGWSESEYWRHCETLNKTYDRVLKECPDVCLENCASGGGRNDLGQLARFHYLCQSDWSVHPFAIRAINAMTLFIPPEAVAYYHNHMLGAHQRADLDTHLRVTLFGVPIFVGFGAQDADRTTPYFQKTKRYIDLHKGFCRPVLAGHPVVFHHTPDIGVFAPADWCVLEYATPDASRGYAGLFKLSGGEQEYRFRPRGIDPAREYDVTLDNRGSTVRMAGRELELTGLTVRLDAALTSELILYQACE